MALTTFLQRVTVHRPLRLLLQSDAAMRGVSLVLAFGFVVILGLVVMRVLSGASEAQGVACFSLAILGLGVALGLGLRDRR